MCGYWNRRVALQCIFILYISNVALSSCIDTQHYISILSLSLVAPWHWSGCYQSYQAAGKTMRGTRPNTVLVRCRWCVRESLDLSQIVRDPPVNLWLRLLAAGCSPHVAEAADISLCRKIFSCRRQIMVFPTSHLPHRDIQIAFGDLLGPFDQVPGVLNTH